MGETEIANGEDIYIQGGPFPKKEIVTSLGGGVLRFGNNQRHCSNEPGAARPCVGRSRGRR